MYQKLLIAVVAVLMLAVVSCKKKVQVDDACDKATQAELGMCEALFTAYYYDYDKCECRSISVSGCQPLPFATMAECEQRCSCES